METSESAAGTATTVAIIAQWRWTEFTSREATSVIIKTAVKLRDCRVVGVRERRVIIGSAIDSDVRAVVEMTFFEDRGRHV